MAVAPASFDPGEFFSFASGVTAKDSPTEGELRSAISRAYYSVFLTARDRLFGPDGIRLKGHVNRQLIMKYRISKKSKRGPASHERIIFAVGEMRPVASQQMDMLREARVNADYMTDSARVLRDVRKASWEEYAAENVALASQLLPLVKGLPSY